MLYKGNYLENAELIIAAFANTIKYGWGVSNEVKAIAPVKALLKRFNEAIKHNTSIELTKKETAYTVCSLLEMNEYGNHSESMLFAILDVIEAFDPARAKFIRLEKYAESLGFHGRRLSVPDSHITFVLTEKMLDLEDEGV